MRGTGSNGCRLRCAAVRSAVVVRVVSDFGDAVVFGIALPDATTKAKVAGFAAAWGALCAYSGRHTGWR
ncbi:hypothetical protein M2275_006661 [Rhodococcus opacus]|nr:hypothetical protein [Rhodococcus opacus]